jgi:hypothetical protein
MIKVSPTNIVGRGFAEAGSQFTLIVWRVAAVAGMADKNPRLSMSPAVMVTAVKAARIFFHCVLKFAPLGRSRRYFLEAY